jgi:hypothetical protein
MQLQLVPAGEPRQFDEIVNAFTPPMRRVCGHMGEAPLREMIERMAAQQLVDEQRRRATMRGRVRVRTRSTRDARALRAW